MIYHFPHNGNPSPSEPDSTYHRYHIDTVFTPDIVPWPPKFNVKVRKFGLARLLITELFKYRGDLATVISRPCVYGVFSGPIGGFSPRPQYCVGCLRCTTQYPEWVRVEHNLERQHLGDSYFTFQHVNSVTYEAETGSVPVKGAGYRGQFGGAGWDGMWTDMSEIVRPTRDGIHGREFISTSVDLGEKPSHLTFTPEGQLDGALPNTFSIPIPTILDLPPQPSKQNGSSTKLAKIFTQAAEALNTLAILEIDSILQNNFRGIHVVPLLSEFDINKIQVLPFKPRLVEMNGWSKELFETIRQRLPDTLICLRTPFPDGNSLPEWIEKGVRFFHFTANYHGLSKNGTFVFDSIRDVHLTLVEAGIRDEVTLIGSGGIIAAEHVPKAIIAGLDAVALDTPLIVALQAIVKNEFTGDPEFDRDGGYQLPRALETQWGTQRIINLISAWRDQLLEILGAMGIREVRRLRGEIGRAMFQKDLEREAFADIQGYPPL